MDPFDMSVSDWDFYQHYAQLARTSRDRWMKWARECRGQGDLEAMGRCVAAARAQLKQVLKCVQLASWEWLP